MAVCFHCLRGSTVVSCVLLLVVVTQGMGGVLIWAGYEVHYMTVLSTLEDYHTQDFGWMLLSFGTGVIAVGLLGILVAFDKSRCVICLVTAKQYLTPELVLAAAVLGAGCFLLYLKGPVQDTLSSASNCKSESILETSERAVSRASDFICTIMCPCNYTAQLQAYITGSGSSKLLVPGSATSILNCKPCENIQQTLTSQQLDAAQSTFLAAFNLTLASCQSMSSDDFLNTYFTADERSTFDLLEWAEDRYECAGICTTAFLYLFSSLDRGVPVQPCRSFVSDWLQDNLPLYGGLTAAIGGFLFLVGSLTATLCCVRKKPLKPEVPQDVSNTNLICA